MFESIWYKCSKLNSDLVSRASTAYDMEVEALQHILAWLGERLRRIRTVGQWSTEQCVLRIASRNMCSLPFAA
jgi:hypothetical protein